MPRINVYSIYVYEVLSSLQRRVGSNFTPGEIISVQALLKPKNGRHHEESTRLTYTPVAGAGYFHFEKDPPANVRLVPVRMRDRDE
jgi:hypothetical protein